MQCGPLDFGVENSPDLNCTGGKRERARPLGWAGWLTNYDFDLDLMVGAYSLLPNFLFSFSFLFWVVMPFSPF